MIQDMVYSKHETEFFQYLFNISKKPTSNYIEGPEVANLFFKAGLGKDILRTIWENSNSNKTKYLDQHEFFFACRHVALAQCGLKFEKENFLKMNKNQNLPKFKDINFIYTTKDKDEDDDDDEFVSIEEDTTGTTYTNKENNTTGKGNHTNHKNASNIKNVENKKKRLDDLCDLLQSFPIEGEKNSSANNSSNTNQEVNHDKIIKPVKQTKEDADEFISIEEDNNYTQNPPQVTFAQVFQTDNTHSNANTTSFNQTIPNNIPKPKAEDKVTEINFQEMIFNKNWKQATKSSKVEQETNEIQVINSVTTTVQETSKNLNVETSEPKVTISMADLLNTVDLDLVVDNTEKEKEREPDTNINMMTPQKEEERKKESISEFQHEDEHVVKKENEMEDLEFCEAEEVEERKENRNGNAESNGVQQKAEEINMNVEKKEDLPLAKTEDSVPQNKISILNYTPLDFLNEFTKENNVKGQNVINEPQGEFEFYDPEQENANNTQAESNRSKDKNWEKLIFDKNLHIKFSENKSLVIKFKQNLFRVSRVLAEEFPQIVRNLRKIQAFGKKKVTKLLFETNRKLNVYLNSSIQMVLLYKKIKLTEKYLKECDGWSEFQLNMNQKAFEDTCQIIEEFRKMVEINDTGLTLSSMLSEAFLSRLDLFDERYLEEGNGMQCSLCLHQLEFESSTNVFGYDFHTSCINFWLNLVESNSPFALS